ncbi:MAG: amidohydrolase family protein [Atopobiaceae bacterium]|nr:amidohydrolase family protein [Atopobiaceae bacterium]
MKYAFTHATILDGSAEMEPQEDMTLLVDDAGKIAEIGPSSTTRVPPETRTVDLRGAFLMPGLINMHVHLTGTGEPISAGGASKLIDFVLANPLGRAYIRRRIRKNAETAFMSGTTTVRGVGDPAWCDIAVRNSIEKRRILGPRLLVSGWGVTPPEGHGRGLIAKQCDTVEDAVELTREIAKHDADLVRLFITGGVYDSEVAGEFGIVRMSQEMADAVVAEAHGLGLSTATHVESREGVRIALRASVDTIEHGSVLDDEMIGLFGENGAGRKSCLVCTLSPAMPLSRMDPKKTHSTDVVKANADGLAEEMIEGVKRARELGIDIGLGTDAGCPYITHYDMWRELVYFHEIIGADTRETLHRATAVNARLLGIDKVTGTVEAGKDADLIVTDKNPLENLEELRHVRMVMGRGMLVRHPRVKRFLKLDAELDEILHG